MVFVSVVDVVFISRYGAPELKFPLDFGVLDLALGGLCVQERGRLRRKHLLLLHGEGVRSGMPLAFA